MQQKRKKIQTKKGFTIAEVVLSATVLSVGIVAGIGLIAQSIKQSMDIRDQIIASNLAQEGVELARNVRDNSWLDLAAPCNGKPFCEFSDGDCNISKNNVFDTSSPDYVLYYKSNFYNHDSSGAVATKFRRKVNIDCKQSNDTDTNCNSANVSKAVVKSTVIWSGTVFPATCGTSTQCAEVTETLQDWH